MSLLLKVLFSVRALSFTTSIFRGLVMIVAVLIGAQASRSEPGSANEPD